VGLIGAERYVARVERQPCHRPRRGTPEQQRLLPTSPRPREPTSERRAPGGA